MKISKVYSPMTRILSLVLSLLIAFYSAPITVSAEESDNQLSENSSAIENNTETAEKVAMTDEQNDAIYEMVSLRQENVKHFRLADGSYVAAQYNYPVHYKDENGEFIDINNQLVSSGSEFATENSRVKFIKKITGNGNIFTLHENNTKITMGLVGAEKKTEGVVTSGDNSDDYIEDALGKMTNLENISSTILYPEILDGVDIEYVVHSLNIKENIIVKERKDSYSYTFTLELNNLTAALSEDGNVYIRDESKEIKYVIPAPIVYDENGQYAPDGAATYCLEEVGNDKFHLTVNVSSEWMNNSDRAYPVTIDPPIESAQGAIVDLYVDKNAPSSITGTENYLKVSGAQRSYIKFDNSCLGSIPTGASIMQAQLNIVGRKIGGATPKVGIYKVVSSWNELLNYNRIQSAFSSGELDDNALDYAIIEAYGVRYSFDITELYEGWINGESNFGVALKLIDENTTEQAWFYSCEYNSGDDFSEPVLLVTYIYNDGLESYFPTSTHSAGVGGAGSINLATGRLALAIPTLTTTDNLFGFTPTLVYNSSLAGKSLTNANIISPFSTSYLPFGFKLNLQEFIQEKSYIDSEGNIQTYYALYDADGTIHTLYYVDGVIRDDSGLGLKLTFENGNENVIITDKSHTKRTYTSYDSSNWYLTSVTDKFGNKLIFNFDSSYRPTSIKVKPVDLNEITMLNFIYSGNMLSAVYNSTSSDFVRLNYSGNYLSTIEYGIGDPSSSTAAVYASASYTYDSNGYITKITDNTTNKSIEYGISGGKITTVSEWAGDTLGQKMSFSYEKGCTFVNTSGNDEILGTNDDTTTQYVLDRLGRAVAVNSYDVVGGTIYHSSIGVYGEFQAVAKNSLVETANIPTVGGYIEDFDAYTTSLNGYVGQEGTYTHVFYDKTRATDADISYTELNKFRISGLAKANSVIQNGFADFSLKVKITYTHGIATLFSFSFADAEDVWQMASGSIDCEIDDETTILRIISKIEIICSYNGQLNSPSGEAPYAHFDKISFVESSDVDTTKYTYDANGNIAIKTIGTYEEYYEYDKNGNVIRIANNRGELYNYSYNENNTLNSESYYTFCRTNVMGNLLYIYPYDTDLIENPDAIIDDPSIRANIDPYLSLTTISSTSYTYNSYGLVTFVLSHAGSSDSITSNYTYDVSSGSKIFGALLTETDSLGHVTKYFYDSTNGNLLAEVDVSTGSGYVYTYDEIGRLEKVTPASGNATSYSGVANVEEVEYTYDEALRLSKINTATTEYTFTYDIFGNSTSVSAGNNTLATYEYNSNNGKLKKINYGNGFSEEYVYGTLEKVEGVWYNYSDGTRVKAYSYEYDSNSGSLEKFTDNINGKVTTYTYDLNGRFVSSSETKASNPNYKNQYSVNYDDHGRIIRARNLIDYLVSSTVYNTTVTTEYEYNTNGTLKNTGITLPNDGVIESDYSYGEFNRLTGISHSAGSFDQDISYEYYSYSNKSIGLITGYTSTVNGTATTFGYTYDSKGNITKITNSRDDDIIYTYDDLGQLISEVKGNTTRTYTYDNAGNITSITDTTERETIDPDPGFSPIIHWNLTPPTVISSTQTLGYTNSQWGDLLTSYNGTAITYDGIGNPLSYYNGSSYTFTWEGRSLVGAVKGSNTMSFEYNDEGIRTSKTVNGVETTYYVNGGQIIAEKTGTRTIVYIYDASGAPIGMMYRTTSYAEGAFDVFWYEKNLQGDIVAVYNSSGTKLVTYDYYDAWGNFTVSYSNNGATTGAQYNPFRYRGYYYDSDLGMYYLQSRYYDAKICRFISVDGYVSTGQGILSTNMFAYCGNNPVMGYDPQGFFDIGWLLGAITDALVTTFAFVTSAAVTLSTGDIYAGISAFSTINNFVNSVYYNYFAEERELSPDQYKDRYLTRWERLDYTKKETKSQKYGLNDLRFYGEYSFHMYMWYATGWSYDKNIPIISDIAKSAEYASVYAYEWESGEYSWRNILYLLMGGLGI